MSFVGYFLIVVLFGYVFLKTLRISLGWMESFVYSLGLGFLGVSFFMFLSAVLTKSFFVSQITCLICAAAGSVFFIRDFSGKKINKDKIGFWLLVIVGFCYLAHPLSRFSFLIWDSWASYGLKAKIFFFEQTIPLEKFSNTQFLVFLRHPFYPINLALNEAFLATIAGVFDGVKIRSIFLFFGLCSVSFFYLTAKKILANKTRAAFFTAVFAFTPAVISHTVGTYAGCSDSIFMFYNFVAVITMYWAYLQKSHGYFFLSSIFAGAALWTKFEGFVCIGAIIVGIFYVFSFKEALKRTFWYLIFPVFINAGWFIVKLVKKLEFQYSFAGRPIFEDCLVKIGMYSQILMKEFFYFEKWGAVWIVFAFCWINAVISKSKQLKYLALICGLEIVGYVVVLALLSSADALRQRIVYGPVLPLERTLLHVLPIAMILVAGTLVVKFENKGKPE